VECLAYGVGEGGVARGGSSAIPRIGTTHSVRELHTDSLDTQRLATDVLAAVATFEATEEQEAV